MAQISSAQAQANLNENPFPNENVDPEKKKKKAFGEKVAKAIYAKGVFDETLSGRRANISINRAYARGAQDPNMYKPMINNALDNPGDKSWINISWAIESPAPVAVSRLLGRFMNIDLKCQARSIDSSANSQKMKARDEYFGKMIQARDIANLEKEFGVELKKPKGFIPEDEDALNMHMEMDFRLPIEVGMEELIDFTFKYNSWVEKYPRCQRDLIENKKAAVRWFYDENNNIKVRYVDIENLIHSYTDDPYYNDIEYAAEVVYITIRELRKLSNGGLSEDALFQIAKMGAGQYGNPQWMYGDVWNANGYYQNYEYRFDDYRIQVLDFVYYTTDVYKYEKKKTKQGNNYFFKKKFNYVAPERSQYFEEMVEKQIEMEYEGMWVIGTEYMVKYGRSRNITRPSREGKLSPIVLKKFIIVEPGLLKGYSKSLIELVIPNLDNIQLAALRKRHLIAEAIPPGMYVDYDSVNEIAIAMGETPKSIINIFKQKGILFGRSKDINDNQNYGKPAEFMMNGIGDALRPFNEIIQTEINTIYTYWGINTPVDQMQPDKRSLIGLEKMQLLESNNATRELFEAYSYGILNRSGKIISRMLQDKVRFNGGLDQYESVIGDLAVKSIGFVPADMTQVEFGIFIEALPDGAEMQQLLMDLQKSVDSGEIGYEDGLEVRNIMNLKKAAWVLGYKKKKRKEREMQEFAQKEQITAQREQASAIAAAEAQKMKDESATMSEIAVINAQKEADKELELVKRTTEIQVADRKGLWEIKKIEAAREGNFEDTSGLPTAPDPKIFNNPLEATTRVME